MELRTKAKLARQERDKKVLDEWNEMMAQPGAMASRVNEIIAKKYGFASVSSVWLARKRATQNI